MIEKSDTKVVHVHMIFEKKDYYFGSFSAIFEVLSEDELGITKNTLTHAGMKDGDVKYTRRARIVLSHLIRNRR